MLSRDNRDGICFRNLHRLCFRCRMHTSISKSVGIRPVRAYPNQERRATRINQRERAEVVAEWLKNQKLAASAAISMLQRFLLYKPARKIQRLTMAYKFLRNISMPSNLTQQLTPFESPSHLVSRREILIFFEDYRPCRGTA
jgi:hypothetical protein